MAAKKSQSETISQTMQKKPQTLVARFHAMFTTHILLGIIGALLGTIALRLLGF
jgi:hypothetical protein